MPQLSQQQSPAAISSEPDKWVWEVDHPLFAGVGGDIAQIFKAGDFDTPGVLAENPPSDAASLFAREAIQNSWDAAREWQRECAKEGRKVAPFSIEFRFEEFSGMEKRRRLFALGLDEHARVHNTLKSRMSGNADLGLADEQLLVNLSSEDTPLRILTLTESGGLGMPGHFNRGESRMMKALLRVGVANEAEGAGGAFGFGKAGLIAASRIRVVVAYTAYAPVSSEPDVSRRLLGVTYWKGYHRGQHRFNGWARLGSPMEIPLGDTPLVTAKPFENDEADLTANALGLPIRDPGTAEGTGTTFLLIDPAITATDLKRAVERYWWPAMLDEATDLRISIFDYDGKDFSPQVPHDDPHLSPFIKSYLLATQTSRNPAPEEARFELPPFTLKQPKTSLQLGTLGLVAEPTGWSFPDDNEFDHKSIIALMRGPRMVVNYHTFSKVGLPHIRGVFVADNAVDDYLRATEDPAHTKWSKSVKLTGKKAIAPSIAKEVLALVREKLDEFRKGFAPPPRRPDDLTLPTLDELSKLMRGKKVRPPEGALRQVRITLTKAASSKPTTGGELQCVAGVSVKVSDWVWEELDKADSDVNVSSVRVAVEFSVAFMEDDEIGERLPLKVTCSDPAFLISDLPNRKTLCEGDLGRGQSVEFSINSVAYSPDWTVRFTPTANITSPKVPARKKSEVS